jgi:myo-inositol-1(or 4)-monophosphatase
VANEVAGFRCVGSTALSLAGVAAGRGDIFFQKGTMPWDVAAGILLIREAGGYVSSFSGRDTILEEGSIIACNDTLHPLISKLIQP